MTEAPRMPYLDRWMGVLAADRTLEEARKLASRVRSRYEELYAQRENPTNRAMRRNLERVVLPTVSLFRVLLEDMGDRQAALDATGLCDIAADKWFMPLVYSKAVYSMPPGPFAAFRRMMPIVAKWRFPAPYMGLDFVENSKDACRIKVNKCFFLDTLEKYDAPELARFFCTGDDRFYYESLPPSIGFEHPKAMARGDEYCEMTFRKIG